MSARRRAWLEEGQGLAFWRPGWSGGCRTKQEGCDWVIVTPGPPPQVQVLSPSSCPTLSCFLARLLLSSLCIPRISQLPVAAARTEQASLTVGFDGFIFPSAPSQSSVSSPRLGYKQLDQRGNSHPSAPSLSFSSV